MTTNIIKTNNRKVSKKEIQVQTPINLTHHMKVIKAGTCYWEFFSFAVWGRCLFLVIRNLNNWNISQSIK